jgi:hypothetical protein
MTRFHPSNRSHALLRFVALAAALVLTGATAKAEILTFRFSGTANAVGTPLQTYFSVGNPFTFTLSYDTAATGTYSGDYSRTFSAISAVLQVAATGGTWTTTFTNPEIQLEDWPGYDKLTVTAGFPPFTSEERFLNNAVGGQTLSTADFRLYSEIPGTVENFTMLPTGFNLADWSSNPSSSGVFTYWEPGTGTYFMRFSVSGVESLSAVPEPSTYALIGGGIALTVVLLRRIRRTD